MLMDALEDDTDKLEEVNNFDKALEDILSIFQGFTSGPAVADKK